MVPFSLLISCCAKPRLLTSSMLRRDSVVDPASAVVSFTIAFWTALIFLLRRELKPPSRGIVNK